MGQKRLAGLLKLVVVGIGFFGALFYLYAIPEVGKETVLMYPEYGFCYWPWFIFLLLTAIPCYLVLILGWRMFEDIRQGRSFTRINSRRLHQIAQLAVFDVIFTLLGNIVMGMLFVNHPGVLILFLCVCAAGLAFAVVAQMLSLLVQQAADLQDENELTI